LDVLLHKDFTQPLSSLESLLAQERKVFSVTTSGDYTPSVVEERMRVWGIGQMMLTGDNRVLWGKLIPMTLCPPHIPRLTGRLSHGTNPSSKIATQLPTMCNKQKRLKSSTTWRRSLEKTCFGPTRCYLLHTRRTVPLTLRRIHSSSATYKYFYITEDGNLMSSTQRLQNPQILNCGSIKKASGFISP